MHHFGSNGIHEYRKKPQQIETFPFNHILVVNMIYMDLYCIQYYTLDHEILLVEPYKSCESGILQIQEFRVLLNIIGGEKMQMKDPNELNWAHEFKK